MKYCKKQKIRLLTADRVEKEKEVAVISTDNEILKEKNKILATKRMIIQEKKIYAKLSLVIPFSYNTQPKLERKYERKG